MTDEESQAVTLTSAYVWKPWKIAGLVFSGLLVAAGALLALGGDSDGDPTETATAHRLEKKVVVPGGESLLPGHTPTVPPSGSEPGPEVSAETEVATEGGTEGGTDLSPALLRGGLSFFLAFALGFAARAFIRIALFFVGVWAASLFFLSSVGWVEVHWDIIDVAFSGWADGIGAQFESVRTFITGSLPSASMAGLGLFTGIRRK